MWHKKHDESQPFALSQSLTKGHLEDDNLLSSTIAQLAWEKDIDLTKGHQFVSDLDNISPRSPSLLSPAHHFSPLHIPNGSFQREAMHLTQSDAGDAVDAPLPPSRKKKNLVYNRVAPLLLPINDRNDLNIPELTGDAPDAKDLSLEQMSPKNVSNTNIMKSNIPASNSQWQIEDEDTESGKEQSSFSNSKHLLKEGKNSTSKVDTLNGAQSKDSGVVNPAFDTCWMEEFPAAPVARKRKKKIKKAKMKSKKKNPPVDDKGSNSSTITLLESGNSKV